MSNPNEDDGHVDPIRWLVGMELGAVEFIRDSVRLHFDGPTASPILTAMTHPTVEMAEQRLDWDTPGYRDVSCERISRTAIDGFVADGEQICVMFEDGWTIAISLRAEDYECSEPAVPSFLPDPQCWVW